MVVTREREDPKYAGTVLTLYHLPAVGPQATGVLCATTWVLAHSVRLSEMSEVLCLLAMGSPYMQWGCDQ